MEVIDDPYKVLIVPEGVRREELMEFWKKSRIKIIEIGGRRKRVMGVKHLREICAREKIG